jgi:hypothetical protein
MLVDLNQFEAYYLRHLDEGEEYFQRIKQRFLMGVLRVVVSDNPMSIVVERSDSIVLLSHFAAEMPLTQAQRATQNLAEKICASVPETLKELSISIAIGGFYGTVAQLRHSCQRMQKVELPAGMFTKNSLTGMRPPQAFCFVIPHNQIVVAQKTRHRKRNGSLSTLQFYTIELLQSGQKVAATGEPPNHIVNNFVPGQKPERVCPSLTVFFNGNYRRLR